MLNERRRKILFNKIIRDSISHRRWRSVYRDEFSTRFRRDWKCAWKGVVVLVENIKGGRKVLVRATCWATYVCSQQASFVRSSRRREWRFSCSSCFSSPGAVRKATGPTTWILAVSPLTGVHKALGMFAASLKGSCHRYFKRNVLRCWMFRKTIVASFNGQLVDSRKIIQDYFISIKMLQWRKQLEKLKF